MSEKDYSQDVDQVVKDIDFTKEKFQIQMETSMGPIKLDLYPDVAPDHCKNIIGLASVGFYDDLLFHRVIDGFVIQGGCPNGTGTGGPGYNVKAEFNEKKHRSGTLSMARAQDPNSAGSQFFLCLGDVPYLDNQYTVFGQTSDEESLKTVLEIGKVQTGAQDRPVEDVIIKNMKVVSSELS